MRWLALLAALALALCPLCAAAGETAAVVEDARTHNGDNYVAYPLLSGWADEAVERAVNDDVVLSGGISRHMVTLMTLGEASPIGLRVDYEAWLHGDVYSVALSAKGKQPGGRAGHAYTALVYDLRTGARLSFGDLFADAEGAAAYMERSLAASLEDELSSYYTSASLTPLPVERFTVDEDGVTLWYPYEQFAYLSEVSGSCHFLYAELTPWLDKAEDGLPARLGALPKPLSAAESRAIIERAASDGRLPHVPVTLGEPMADAIARLRLMRDPDERPGGRYFTMEAAKLRDALVISDAMQSGWDESVVEGVRAERGELGGLLIGSSRRDDWLAILGEPAQIIEMTENMAYDYGLPAGQCDVYEISGRELRLYADADGTLRCVQLGL